MAAVILRLHSSPSMIQLSGRAAGFIAPPPVNGPPQSWLDSRGYAVRMGRSSSVSAAQVGPTAGGAAASVSPPHPATTGRIDGVIDGSVAMETDRLYLIGYFWLWEPD